MFIQVARVPPEGLDISGKDPDVFPAAAGQPCEYQVKDPVDYKFRVNYVSGELIVMGRVGAMVHFECSRCAGPCETYVSDPSFNCIFEAPEGTESVDLTEEVREAILCAFPSHPVCRGDCKGLCTHCGKDLNEGSCGCGPGESGTWAALSGLKL